MKLTLGQIYNSVPSLISLKKQSLPISIAYSVNQLCKKVDEEIKALNEIKTQRLKQYFSEENEVPKNTDEKYIKFIEILNVELNELSLKESEIDVKKIKLNEVNNISLSPNDLQILDWLFTND